MTAKGMIQEKIQETGIPLAELSRRTGIPYSKIYRVLKGSGRLDAEDFILFCKVLKIEVK